MDDWHPYLDWLGQPITHEQWVQMFPDERHLADDQIGDVEVSTVWMGINHQWRPGEPPLIFETMIFGGEHDGWGWRYSTEREAREGHARAVALVRAAVH